MDEKGMMVSSEICILIFSIRSHFFFVCAYTQPYPLDIHFTNLMCLIPKPVSVLVHVLYSLKVKVMSISHSKSIQKLKCNIKIKKKKTQPQYTRTKNEKNSCMYKYLRKLKR